MVLSSKFQALLSRPGPRNCRPIHFKVFVKLEIVQQVVINSKLCGPAISCRLKASTFIMFMLPISTLYLDMLTSRALDLYIRYIG